MIILITGATHTGKTCLAQKLLEKLHYPYLSLDHLKMGLIRSGHTTLTPEDDREMTGFIWPITREIIKTAIENKQNLIIEGCYVPFDWKVSFEKDYLEYIEYLCLAFTDEYIENSFHDILSHGSDIEKRLDDSYCNLEWLKIENQYFVNECRKNGNEPFLIQCNYEKTVLEEIVENSNFGGRSNWKK